MQTPSEVISAAGGSKGLDDDGLDIKAKAAQAKDRFVKDLMNMTDYNEAKAIVKDDDEEEIDPRTVKFVVVDPAKVSGHI